MEQTVCGEEDTYVHTLNVMTAVQGSLCDRCPLWNQEWSIMGLFMFSRACIRGNVMDAAALICRQAVEIYTQNHACIRTHAMLCHALLPYLK